MKIGGNQAEAFPDLPIQPRNLDFVRKTKKNRFVDISEAILIVFLLNSKVLGWIGRSGKAPA